jgi:predicted component of type VI protein secretion system
MSEKANSNMLTIAATVMGILAGMIGTYLRLESEMEEEITRRVQFESRLSAVETQSKTNKDDIWTIRMQAQGSGQ